MESTVDECIKPYKLIEQNLGLPKCFPKGSMMSRIKAFVDFKVAQGFPDDFYYVKEGTVRPIVTEWHELRKLQSKEQTEETKKRIAELQYRVDFGVGVIKDAIVDLSKQCEAELALAKTTVTEFEESMTKLNINENKLPKAERIEFKEARKAIELGVVPKRDVLQKTVSEKLREITSKTASEKLPTGKIFNIPLKLTKEDYDRWVNNLCEDGNPPRDNNAFAEIIFAYVDSSFLKR